MNHLLEDRMITTRDAGKISGYSPDYIARAARSGEVVGKKVGHNWLVDKESLLSFLDTQKLKKAEYAHTLAHIREMEYHSYHADCQNVTIASTTTTTVYGSHVHVSSIIEDVQHAYSYAFALAVALLVVVCGAYIARTTAIPRLASTIGSTAQIISNVFNERLEVVSQRFARDTYNTQKEISSRAEQAIDRTTRLMVNLGDPILADTITAPLYVLQTTPLAMGVSYSRHPTEISGEAYEHLKLSVATVMQTVSSPSHMARVFADSYYAAGLKVYRAMVYALALDLTLIQNSGAMLLAGSTAFRDLCVATPVQLASWSRTLSQLGMQADLALGSAIINGTHASIRADVDFAYGVSKGVSTAGRFAIAALVRTGGVLAFMTAQVPRLVANEYMRIAGVPAHVAPLLAESVWGATYVGASYFVSATDRVLERYLALVQGTGNLAYIGVTSIGALAQTTTHYTPLSKVASALSGLTIVW